GGGAGEGGLGVDDDGRGASAAEADHADCPGGVERSERAEKGRGGAGVADGRVDACRGGSAAADRAGGGRAEAAVGVGERPRVDVERGQLLAHLLDDGKEDLLAEESGVVDIARPVVAVGAIAIEERGRSGDTYRRRCLAAPGRETDGRRPRT